MSGLVSVKVRLEPTKPHGLSERNFRGGLKALLSKWARATQARNVQRLRYQVEPSGAPMQRLSKFWAQYKADQGLHPEIGKATGRMFREHDSARNITLNVTGAECSARITSALSEEIILRIDGFQRGFFQRVSSLRQQRKLEIMAEQIGLKNRQAFVPPGEGAFGEGKLLYHPPRPWIARNETADAELARRVTHMMLTGRRRGF